MIYDYNQETGQLEVNDETKQPLERDPNFPAPCRMHAMGKKRDPCPKGTPEQPKTLSQQNQDAVAYNRECRATGQWPDDGVVRMFAAIIDEIDRAEAERRQRLLFLSIKAGQQQ